MFQLVTPFNDEIATINAILCDEVPVGTPVQAVTLTEVRINEFFRKEKKYTDYFTSRDFSLD